MVKLTINHQPLEVQKGTTVWQAANSAGIVIPTICFQEEAGHFASCMICFVKNVKTGQLFASCSTPAMEGAEIVTEDPEILESRKTALELLLSEHVGDCEAPCQLVCPAHMNIPLMNRLIAKGDFAKALEVVKRDIALPSILGNICPAPCEAGCRRKQVDESVSICLLKRYVGELDLKESSPCQVPPADPSGKKVAVIGAGPAGLSAAWYLQNYGHSAVIFEKSAEAGGALLQIHPEILSPEVLKSEIALVQNSGVTIRFNESIDEKLFNKILLEYDAIVVATGIASSTENEFGLKSGKTGISVGKLDYQTSIPKVFAIGNSLRPSKMAVRSVGQGKEVAWVINQFFQSGEIADYPGRFNSNFGRLAAEEMAEYMKEAESLPRQNSLQEGFSQKTAVLEAMRCMHCDCRKPESCLLRAYSDQYQSDQKRFKGDVRNKVEKLIHREGIVFEPAKCIKCGICVRLTRLHKEELGLTFVGRGFDVRIGVPFNETIQRGLQRTAFTVAKACPTGALSAYGEEEQLNL
jgi:hypothetical protein